MPFVRNIFLTHDLNINTFSWLKFSWNLNNNRKAKLCIAIICPLSHTQNHLQKPHLIWISSVIDIVFQIPLYLWFSLLNGFLSRYRFPDFIACTFSCIWKENTERKTEGKPIKWRRVMIIFHSFTQISSRSKIIIIIIQTYTKINDDTHHM